VFLEVMVELQISEFGFQIGLQIQSEISILQSAIPVKG